MTAPVNFDPRAKAAKELAAMRTLARPARSSFLAWLLGR